MSFETSGLSIDTLLDIILMKLSEDAICAKYYSDSKFQKLDIKTSRVLAQVRFTRNTLSPVHTLPPETLAIIFQYVLDDCFGPNSAPREDFYKWTAITRVCRYWRESALSFATLWSTVSMGNLPAAVISIERSRGTLLDIYVPSHQPLNGVWDKIRDHMPRVRKLAAKVYHLDTLKTSLGSPILAPNLQTLDIHKIGTQDRPLPLLFDWSIPNLSSVRLSGISDWKPNHFAGLKQLSIENVHQALPLGNLLDILEANPTLEYLELWHAEPTAELTLRHITLPNLRLLKFSSGSPRQLLESISLPSTCRMELTSMVLDPSNRSIFECSLPSESRSFPNIKDVGKLKINIGDGVDGIEISGAASSSTFRLQVSSMARTLIQSTLSSFGPLSAASIREVSVQGCHTLEYPDPEAWKPLLGSMTSLETLWLVKSDCDPVLQVLGADSRLLPSMRSLRVCSDRLPSPQAVRKMAQARRDQGHPIEHLLVACCPEDAESWNGLVDVFGVVDVVRPRDFPVMLLDESTKFEA
ncbi:hypothetical protein BDM02DRAFT_3269399 [Thelephora ganbajun]|uniref:Uncharacterized protein n=1 Tax=Thelephora ganbajun TaxID=370292 RepID=A0ACB6ZHI3_THEGA|nr:hypothetical protein BDM02DRAFT_3269399 [Thelephora ganbajun]